MLMTGAQILMECLLEQGVDTVFGFPGGKSARKPFSLWSQAPCREKAPVAAAHVAGSD